MVLDTSGTSMVRIGKYGNADDTEADLKAGGDGLHFVRTRSVCASDSAVCSVDFGNRRIIGAVLSFAAKEMVSLE